MVEARHRHTDKGQVTRQFWLRAERLEKADRLAAASGKVEPRGAWPQRTQRGKALGKAAGALHYLNVNFAGRFSRKEE